MSQAIINDQQTLETNNVAKNDFSQQNEVTLANSVQSNEQDLDSLQNLTPEKPLVSSSKIMEVGGHIGFSKRRWNPKMKPYIYSKKPGDTRYEVLNIPLMQEKLKLAYDYLMEVARNNGNILFVGTKTKLVQDLIKEIAKRVEINHISQRWLGGTLTNFKTINNSIKQLNNLVEERDNGLGHHTKKEQMLILKKIEKLEKFFGGIKTMKGIPNVLVVDDPIHEKNAVTEARKLNIPVIAIANTNADPKLIDYLVPGNNASIRSITLFMNLFADAVAVAQGKEPLFAYKPDDEIVIAQVTRKEHDQNFSNNRSGQRWHQNRRHHDGHYNHHNRNFSSNQTTQAPSEKPTADQ